MQPKAPKSLNWPEILAALKKCSGESVLVRDGKLTEPAALIRNRPSAKGTELCVFPGEGPATRLDLIERLEELAKRSGRQFMTSARASVGGSFLLVESIDDENVDDIFYAVLITRRTKLGFNQSQQTGDRTTLRSKRIKNT